MVQVCVIGKANSGKTTLINSICDTDKYDDSYHFFVSFRQKTIQGVLYEIFDTKEINDSIIVNIYSKNSSFIILTYDVSKRANEALNYLNRIKQQIDQVYDSKKYIILGNTVQNDQIQPSQITYIKNVMQLEPLFVNFKNTERVKSIVYPLLLLKEEKTKKARDSNDCMNNTIDDCCKLH